MEERGIVNFPNFMKKGINKMNKENNFLARITGLLRKKYFEEKILPKAIKILIKKGIIKGG